MNTRLLVAFLAAASLSGCVVSTGGGGGGGGGGGTVAHPGDVTFTWTFDGLTCAEVPDVQTIRISIAGESLANGGEYPCLVGGYPGIVLSGFAGKSYNFTIEALNGTEQLFVTSGIFSVDGNVTVNVDLQPVTGPHSYAYIGWNFPANGPGPDCSQAGIADVDVRIDGGQWVTHSCTEGNPSWLPTSGLAAGNHTIELEAYDSNGTRYARTSGTFTTYVGNTQSYEFTMAWTVGFGAATTQLYYGNTPIYCSDAGVTTLYVQFTDSSNTVYADYTGQPCDVPLGTYYYHYLPSGTYDVVVYGSGTGYYGGYYASDLGTVTIVNGEPNRFLSNVYWRHL